MSEASVQPQLEQLLEERRQIWQQFADARGVGQELEKLSGQIPACAPQPVGPFTPSRTPPEELVVALKAVQLGLGRTATIAKSIQEKQTEIERLKKRDRVLLGVLIGVAVIVVLIVWSQL